MYNLRNARMKPKIQDMEKDFPKSLETIANLCFLTLSKFEYINEPLFPPKKKSLENRFLMTLGENRNQVIFSNFNIKKRNLVTISYLAS